MGSEVYREFFFSQLGKITHVIAIGSNSVEEQKPTYCCSHPLTLMRGDGRSTSFGLVWSRSGDTLATFAGMTTEYVGSDVSRLKSSFVTILCDNHFFWSWKSLGLCILLINTTNIILRNQINLLYKSSCFIGRL